MNLEWQISSRMRIMRLIVSDRMIRIYRIISSNSIRIVKVSRHLERVGINNKKEVQYIKIIQTKLIWNKLTKIKLI